MATNTDPNNRTAIQRVDPTRLGLPVEPLADLTKVQHALGHAAQQACILLAPVTQILNIPPGYQIAFRVVAFYAGFTEQQNKDKSNGVWYVVDGGKVALHRSALNQLASAAGLSSVIEGCSLEQIEPYYWRAKHTVSMRTFDGQRRQVLGHCEVDLRDSSSETKVFKDERGLNNARKFGSRNADTKAANRAIRAALGIQGAYTREQAELPFVFPVLLWTPDPNNAEIQRMTAAVELGVVDQVYGRAESAPRLLADPSNVVDADELERAEAQRGTPAPVGRDEEPAWSKGGEPAKKAVADPQRFTCDVCGLPLSQRTASRTLDQFDKPLCEDHIPSGGK